MILVAPVAAPREPVVFPSLGVIGDFVLDDIIEENVGGGYPSCRASAQVGERHVLLASLAAEPTQPAMAAASACDPLTHFAFFWGRRGMEQSGWLSVLQHRWLHDIGAQWLISGSALLDVMIYTRLGHNKTYSSQAGLVGLSGSERDFWRWSVRCHMSN